MRLEDPLLGVLDLDAPEVAELIGNVTIDRASPGAREVADVRVNANGTDDQTVFYGASSVSLSFDVYDPVSVGPILDRLRAFASPSRRPVLYFKTAASEPTERRVRLRGDQLGAPLSGPRLASVQVQWKVPDGIVESAVEQVVSVPAVVAGEAGRLYPRTYPLVYPSIPVSGSVSVPNDGTEPAAPVLRLWGPCTDPALVNVTTGQTLAFTGLSLTAEQYAEVDVREATARLNGRVAESLYGRLDLLASAFWWVRSGVNAIRYSPATFGPGAHAQVIYRHTWI